MFEFFLSSLVDNDMGGGDEEGSREGDQGEPVQHHRRELPVVLQPVVLLTFL